ncbi:MAG: GNAT family N-acetyltransferase [Alistipes sp.]|nr:GNAT family N-acetyltransferase [Alistipes sp.]
MKIYRITEYSADIAEAFAKLLPQLSASAQTPTTEQICSLLQNPNTLLLVAENEGAIIGMLSLVIVDIPTGRKAWIEDVVVDEVARGLGVGQALVEEAKVLATSLGARKIYLTSNPSRKAAHALYSKCGFEVYNTTLFRLLLEEK